MLFLLKVNKFIYLNFIYLVSQPEIIYCFFQYRMVPSHKEIYSTHITD